MERRNKLNLKCASSSPLLLIDKQKPPTEACYQISALKKVREKEQHKKYSYFNLTLCKAPI